MKSRVLPILLAALSLSLLLPAPARGQTLQDARGRLGELERRIGAEEAASKRLQAQLGSLAGQVATESGDLREIRADLKATSMKLSATRAQLSQAQDSLHTRARTLYKRGATTLINMVLSGRSIPDFMRRVSYASDVAERDEQLLLDMGRKRARLEDLRGYQVRLEETQRSTVQQLSRRQQLMNEVFATQQAALADLARSRAEALDLVERLAAQLSSGYLARIRRVAGHGMTVSYGEWAEAFLKALGAPVVRSNLVAVVAWEASEGTQATWNPLATTMPMPGATSYNSHNVRNYRSMKQGIDASILTLSRPGHRYEEVVASLRKGNDAMTTGEAINASDWCRGCTNGQYVIGIIPAVEKYYERYAG